MDANHQHDLITLHHVKAVDLLHNVQHMNQFFQDICAGLSENPLSAQGLLGLHVVLKVQNEYLVEAEELIRRGNLQQIENIKKAA